MNNLNWFLFEKKSLSHCRAPFDRKISNNKKYMIKIRFITTALLKKKWAKMSADSPVQWNKTDSWGHSLIIDYWLLTNITFLWGSYCGRR